VRVGDSVFVVGNPLGIGESVSAGIVSALNRNITETPYDDFIQTDAAINHGNSGGPMVNVRGDVIGVATALYSPTDAGSIGLGFAIPAYDVQFVVERLRKYGDLHFGYLGMRMQDVTGDMADAIGLKSPHGAIIASVVPEAPAAAAGIEPGDVVLTFDNKPFTDIRALGRMIATAQIGSNMALTVWRDGQEKKLTAKIDKFPEEMPAKDSGKAAEAPRVFGTNPAQIGMDLEPLTDEGREKFKLAGGVSGVLVSGVTPNTTASDQGLTAGDVIVRVQNAVVSTPEEVQQRLADALAKDHHFALILVQTTDEKKWITVPISRGN
jgi:serine protease Do